MRIPKPCKVDECEVKPYGWGYCQKHYNRWRRHGDPSIVMPRRRTYESAESRIARQSKSEGDCVVFAGGRPSRSGHRQIRFNGLQRGVHRVAWMLANGDIPDGKVVMHRCDNPPCVKLSHLVLGTVADNNRDRDQKGRHRSLPGSKNGNASLTEWQVAEIKVHLAAGVSTYVLAERFQVSQARIWNIKAGKGWSHVAPATWPVEPIDASMAVA
jgi:hypothetical protein